MSGLALDTVVVEASALLVRECRRDRVYSTQNSFLRHCGTHEWAKKICHGGGMGAGVESRRREDHRKARRKAFRVALAV